MPDLPTRRLARPRHQKRSNRLKKFSSLAIAIAIGVTGLAVSPAFAGQSASKYANSPSTEGIFADKSAPKLTSQRDRRSVELGVRFSPKRSGQVTAIQYYQGGRAAGITTATLWSSSGKVLTRAKFKATTKAGWRTIPLDSPVTLSPRHTYVVSYFAPKGGYVSTKSKLAKSLAQGGLSLKASVHKFGKRSQFPTQTNRGSSYLVDVVYVPSSKGAKPTPKPTTPPVTTPARPPVATPTPAPTTPPVVTPTPTTPPVTTPSPTTPPVTTPSPTTPPVATPIAPPPAPGVSFPTRDSAGLPAGWTPKQSVAGDYWIRTAGAVIEDLRVTNGTIFVDAPNVTLRRIEAVGSGIINDYRNVCKNGLLIEDSDFVASGRTSDQDLFVIGPGGYTARNIMVDGVAEGLRVGGKSVGCGPTTIENSYVGVTSPQQCSDWHGDGVQGYDGNALTVRNTTVIMNETGRCYGTAAFFYPSGQGNTSLTVDGLLVGGGGYPFRNGMPASIRNLNIIDRAWGYGPLDVNCSVVSTWDAKIVTLNAAGQPVPARTVSCSGRGN